MHQTATPATPEQLLELVQRSYAMAMGWQIVPLDEFFIIDEGLPGEVIKEAPKLGLTLEEVNAALECWRSKMTQAVEAVTERYKAKAKIVKPNMQPISWADNKELIFRLWSAYNQEHEHEHSYTSSLHDKFSMFEYAPGLGFTPEQIRDAIECWRVKLSEAVYAAAETAAQRYAAKQNADDSKQADGNL